MRNAFPVKVAFGPAALTSMIAAMVAAPARADDWLAVLPSCDAVLARDAAPAFEIAYPRPGLPALVEAGQTLIARVRLPSPLTPPPGVQQERALRGFSAELIGHVRALPEFAGADGAQLEQRYALEVVNVRPDGAASLVYRVSLPIPAWAAPGTYDLALSAPGGSGRAASLVRVLAQGEPARFAWALGGDPPSRAEVVPLPIDVWVRTPSPTPSPSPSPAEFVSPAARAPVLDPTGLSAALRTNRGLWVIGGCESPHLSFDAEVASVLAHEHLDRRSVAAPRSEAWSAARPGYIAWSAASTSFSYPESWLEPEPRPDQVALLGAADQLAVEISFLVAGDVGLVSSNGTLRFFPARDLAPAGKSAPALVAQWRSPDRVPLIVRRAPRPAGRPPVLVVNPRQVETGERTRVAPSLPEPGLRIAYRFDAQHTAFTASAAEHAYQALGSHRVDALAISADGVAHPLQASVRVITAQRIGCRCQLGAGRAVVPGWSWSLGALVLAGCGRQVRARRNRARKARSALRPE